MTPRRPLQRSRRPRPGASGATPGARWRAGPAARAGGGVTLAYLLAGGTILLAGRRIPDGGWLALHLLLLGAVTNAIVVWSEHFAAALLHTPPLGERAALVRLGALNLGVLGVLAGVHSGRTGLVAAGAGLVAVVVAGHALRLLTWIRRGLGRGSATRSGSTWQRAGRCLGGSGSGWC
jgi:nitrite reductase (NO-forming)